MTDSLTDLLTDGYIEGSIKTFFGPLKWFWIICLSRGAVYKSMRETLHGTKEHFCGTPDILLYSKEILQVKEMKRSFISCSNGECSRDLSHVPQCR